MNVCRECCVLSGRGTCDGLITRPKESYRLWRVVGSNPAGGMNVCRECCVLSGRGLCDGLITSPEESYRLWHVVCVISKSS
jgi:hypothetical protein